MNGLRALQAVVVLRSAIPTQTPEAVSPLTARLRHSGLPSRAGPYVRLGAHPGHTTGFGRIHEADIGIGRITGISRGNSRSLLLSAWNFGVDAGSTLDTRAVQAPPGPLATCPSSDTTVGLIRATGSCEYLNFSGQAKLVALPAGSRLA
jgi:hypothetical protein